MRALAKDYLGQTISRRSFIRKSTMSGFSIAAARSAMSALEPLVRAEATRPTVVNTTPFAGTGGELLAEQLRAFGTRFIFICNSSGMGALCDAAVDRPDLQFI
ncbi:MAG TPA: hypothetical protein VKF81_07640, partial [Blastocatellia bacterium]|nr:hypothetical protein [Blastocatellia bacterium]